MSIKLSEYTSFLTKAVLGKESVYKAGPFLTAKYFSLAAIYTLIHELRCIRAGSTTLLGENIEKVILPFMYDFWDDIVKTENHDDLFQKFKFYVEAYPRIFGQLAMTSHNFHNDANMTWDIGSIFDRTKSSSITSGETEFKNFIKNINFMGQSKDVKCFMHHALEPYDNGTPGDNRIVREEVFYDSWKAEVPNKELKIYMHSDHEVYYLRERLIVKDLFYKYCICDSSDIKIAQNFDMSGFIMYSSNKDFKYNFFRANTHTKIGGMEFFFIPFSYLNFANIELICSYLDDIEFYYSTLRPNVECGCILVTGRRRAKKEININKIIEVMDIISAKDFNRNTKRDLLVEERENILFRSSFVDINVVTKCLEENKEDIEKIDSSIRKNLFYFKEEDIRHPLLPPSPGQLGLTLVSGFIDGIIDEGNGNYHVIKGCTKKNTTVRNVTEGNLYHEHHTSSHGTMVRVVTPQGKFINLL